MDHGIGHVAAHVVGGLLHDQAAEHVLGLLVVLLLQLLAQVGLILLQGVELGHVLGELIVQLGKLREGDGVELDLEDHGFAGQIFHIGLGEGDVQILFLADLHAGHLLLKAGNEGVGAQLQLVTLGLAAVKALAVEEAVKVDVDRVAHLGGAVLHGDLAGVLLAGLLQLLGHFLVAGLGDVLGGLQALVLAQGDLGVQGDGEGVAHGALFGDFHVLDGGLTDDAELTLGDALLEGLGGQLVHGVLVENLAAVHVLHDGAGSMALAEAGNIDAALVLQVGAVDGGLKLGGVGLHHEQGSVVLFLFHVLQNHDCFPPILYEARKKRLVLCD